ncbi:MAG: dTMP kinase [Candidatus Hodarchaeales archaeon]|jgi:dTMP kinase
MSVLIALEGIDGSGGSTHSKLLANWLRKKLNDPDKVFHTREPSDLPIGNLMREYLKKKCHPTVDALLYAADRADHYYSVIKPALDDKKIIISDRHKLSSLVYQTVQGLDNKWVQRINAAVPDPDLNIILDIKVDVSLTRKENDIVGTKDKFETMEFLTKVRDKYNYFASRYANTLIVSSMESVDKTQEEVRKVVSQFLEKKKLL